MKKLSLIAVALLAANTAAADPAVGIWQTQPDDNGNFGHVQISTCGSAVCGVILRAFSSDGSPRKSDTVGKRMLWDMSAKGGGAYSGGKIWAPDRDKVYKSKMSLSGNRLKVSGCVGPICRSQTWARVQ